MRSNILEKQPTSSLRVYVVWLDVLPGDSRRLVDTRVLNDARATNYYDSHRVVGPWFSNHVDHESGLAWAPTICTVRPLIGLLNQAPC